MPLQTTVATLLEPSVRLRLDAAAGGSFTTVHAETLPDAIRAVRERPVQAVLVSPRLVPSQELGTVSSLVSGFPGVATIAVMTGEDAGSPEKLLELGACGVRRLVNLSHREGWHQLRELVAQPTSPSVALILGIVIPALGDVPPDCRRMFEALARRAPRLTTVRALARDLRVRPSTFMSRFFRSGLPSPKRYLAMMRLVHAAALLELHGLAVADVAYRLDYSSPQSFGRHVRTALGVTACEFRRRYTVRMAAGGFVTRLIVPFRDVLSTFHPLDHWVAETGHYG
ncbi:MAG TPA: helix-turn-helix transcriptional regulator [Gemmatimonadales bacterium]